MKTIRNGKTRCYASDSLPFNPSYAFDFSEINYFNVLSVADRIQCVNRIIWDQLPSAFSSQDIETMIYSHGAICAFMDRDGTLIFSPFTLTGRIMKKGKLYKIQPITLDGKVYGEKKRVYTPDCKFEFDSNACVIIHDYTGAIVNDKLIPRCVLNRSTTIADEVKVYKQLLYNIVMAVKKILVSGVSEEQKKSIEENTRIIFDPSQPILMFKGDNFSDKYQLTQFADQVDVDSFTRAISFYNKIRRNFNGVPAPDTFEKKERMITPEMEDVGKGTNLILFDALMNRETACNYINSAFGTNITVRINDELEGGYNNGSVYQDMEVQGSN